MIDRFFALANDGYKVATGYRHPILLLIPPFRYSSGVVIAITAGAGINCLID